MTAEEMATDAEYKEDKKYSNYQFNATNSKGKYFIYYSINDTVFVDGSSDSDHNKSRFLNNGIIFLLSLFLF